MHVIGVSRIRNPCSFAGFAAQKFEHHQQQQQQRLCKVTWRLAL